MLGATNIIVRSVKPTIETLAAGGRPTLILNFGLTYNGITASAAIPEVIYQGVQRAASTTPASRPPTTRRSSPGPCSASLAGHCWPPSRKPAPGD